MKYVIYTIGYAHGCIMVWFKPTLVCSIALGLAVGLGLSMITTRAWERHR